MNNDNLSELELSALVTAAQGEGRPVVVLFEDADGNWRGFKGGLFKGNPINVRAGDPNTVLVSLLTHDGNI